MRRQTAIDWAALAPSPYQRENRLAMVRRFAYHVRAEDPRHDLVPRHVFAHQRQRAFPHIFSPEELRQLLEATARLRPRGSLRPHTYYTLFGLLAVTGLRISEAMHLLLSDVTMQGLVVRNTKFRKSRLVPLHPTTAGALERYLEQRQAYAGGDDHVFVSTEGRALSYAMINGTFHLLLRSVDLRFDTRRAAAADPRSSSPLRGARAGELPRDTRGRRAPHSGAVHLPGPRACHGYLLVPAGHTPADARHCRCLRGPL